MDIGQRITEHRWNAKTLTFPLLHSFTDINESFNLNIFLVQDNVATTTEDDYEYEEDRGEDIEDREERDQEEEEADDREDRDYGKLVFIILIQNRMITFKK